MKIYTATEVAAELGIHYRTVLIRAQRENVGTKSNGGFWTFTEAEFGAIRNARDGRYKEAREE